MMRVDDPSWSIAYPDYDPRDEGRREVIFAVGNGVMVSRAASLESRADEYHYPGTYRAACYEFLRSRVNGQRDDTESLARLPNWLWLRFRIEGGEWFQLDKAQLLDYCHSLDMQAGIACREFTFRVGGDRRLHLRDERFVSMARPELAAARVEIRLQGDASSMEVQAGIDAVLQNDNVARYGPYNKQHVERLCCDEPAPGILRSVVQTPQTRIRVAQALYQRCNQSQQLSTRQEAGRIEHCFSAELDEEQALVIDKIASCFSSEEHADPEQACVDALADRDYLSLRESHARRWQSLWQPADMRSDNKAVNLALRFHIFHLLQTASPHSAKLDTGVPARGWHGEGYRGHIFWDDLFVFPFLNFRFPALARALLLYRYRRLDAAREAARAAGYRGAMFPWRSARSGCEVTPKLQYNLLSGRWMQDPTRLQHHINGAIVYNIWHYYLVTGDQEFLEQYGAEIILDIAQFWASIARWSPQHKRYEIKGVIGPDEYHNSYPDRDEAGLDNNAYTNLIAVWSLCRGLDVLEQIGEARKRELLEQLAISAEDLQRWEQVSRRMRIAFHGDGIISQFEGFADLKEFRPDQLPRQLADKRVDWALEAIGESADKYQVSKQADTLTLFYLFSPAEVLRMMRRLGYEFHREQLQRTADFYLQRSMHRSSLSRIVYAGALAYVDPQRSWQIYEESLETDLHALKGESIAEGIHLGAMGGTLDILQRIYLGIDADASGALRLEPAVPEALGEVKLQLQYRGRLLDVAGSSRGLRIRCLEGDPVPLLIRGESVQLAAGKEHFVAGGERDNW